MRQSIDLEQTRFEFPPEGGEIVVAGMQELDWSKANYLICKIETKNEWLVPLIFRFYKEQDEYLQVTMGTIPQTEVIVSFPLSALDRQKVFLPRTPGKLKTLISGTGLSKEEISRITIGTSKSFQSQLFEIKDLYLDVEEPEYLLPDKVMVDSFGQSKWKDWPGKTNSESELVTYLNQQVGVEKKFPSEWSAYGGWKKKQFDSTGFFRTEHDGSRWWLIDPEGYAFWSVGLDCVRPEIQGLLEGLEKQYEWLSETDEYKDMYYQEKDLQFVDYSIANLIRAFGNSYREKWNVMTENRLIEWRINTVGNWSSGDFIKNTKLPYVWPLKDFPGTKKKIFRDFPDAFSEEYVAEAKKYAKQLEEFKDDPYMIGYFLTNEPLWAFAENVNLAEELLEKNEILSSKFVFIDRMRKKYNGNIERFNQAWNVSFNDFKELLAPLKKSSTLSQQAKDDLEAFTRELIYKYTEVVCQAVKEIDCRHLNLGMRYAWISSEFIFEGSSLFDVFTLNNYSMVPNKEDIMEISEKSGLPVLIGEFHFGSVDAGLPATGLKGVASQEDRAKAYRYYIENAATIPSLIGAHYFTLYDQSVLGRFDGENFQIGLLDVCHKPYENFTNGITKSNERIYSVAAGTQQPYTHNAKEIPRIGF
ncbi:beta-galactosidase [Neobacillus vireti]|uniref:beta-galactosidase n=1 Tax=Neobacillus vireti TaxID=220686 RepID=UPI002FFD95F8